MFIIKALPGSLKDHKEDNVTIHCYVDLIQISTGLGLQLGLGPEQSLGLETDNGYNQD